MNSTVDTGLVPRLTNFSFLLDGLSGYELSKKTGLKIPLRKRCSTVEINRHKQIKIIVICDVIIADIM